MENNNEPPNGHQKSPENKGDQTLLRGNEHRDPNAPDPKCAAKGEKITGFKIAEFVLLVFVFFATATAAVYTRKQWLTADDSEKRDLRAYVYLDTQITSWPPGNAPNRYAISLKVTNSGKTWARRLIIDKQVISPEMPEPFDALTKVRHPVSEPIVLGPGQSFTLQIGEVAFSDLPDITAGRKIFDYVAWVRYQDVLNSPPIQWQTQLSMRLVADTEGKGHILSSS